MKNKTLLIILMLLPGMVSAQTGSLNFPQYALMPSWPYVAPGLPMAQPGQTLYLGPQQAYPAAPVYAVPQPTNLQKMVNLEFQQAATANLLLQNQLLQNQVIYGAGAVGGHGHARAGW